MYPDICIPLTIIFMVLFFLLISFISHRKKRTIFKQIAMKKNGRIKGIIDPKLNFIYKGCRVKVKGHPESSGSNKGYAPPETKVIVGGAPLNKEAANKMGADGYAADPQGAVLFLSSLN